MEYLFGLLPSNEHANQKASGCCFCASLRHPYGSTIVQIRENRMVQLDFARCEKGHQTPVQPSTPQSVEAYRRSIETGNEPIFVACRRCNRVYRVLQLASFASTDGLLPHHPEAQLLVFEESIGCDDPAHEFQRIIIGVRSENTSAEDVMKLWRWQDEEDSTCPSGHDIPLPPYQ